MRELYKKKIEKKEIDPHTLIHKAILENSPEVIQFLLAQGVDIDYPDQNGITPLMMAILNQCDYAIEILLQNGANPSVKCKDGRSMLRFALMFKDRKTAELLIKYGAQIDQGAFIDSLRLALNSVDEQERQSWLKTTESILEQAKNPFSAWVFEQIILSGYSTLLEKFIIKFGNEKINYENGVDIKLPLIKAIQKGNLDIVKLLVKYGANVNLETKKNGGTPLFEAIYAKRVDMVKFLVDSGADINQSRRVFQTERDVDGKMIQVERRFYPLEAALAVGQSEVIQYLLQQGARAQ